MFYDFKDKLTDNEYKTGVELLQAMYKKYPCLRQVQRKRLAGRVSTPRGPLIQGYDPTRVEVELSGLKVLRILRALGVSDSRASRVTITATNDLTTSCGPTIRAMVANMMTCIQLWSVLSSLATPTYLRQEMPPRNRMSKRSLVERALEVFTFDITIN